MGERSASPPFVYVYVTCECVRHVATSAGHVFSGPLSCGKEGLPGQLATGKSNFVQKQHVCEAL